MMLGIDYASIDGNRIDPKATGARFAYVRASCGMVTDPTWHLDRYRWSDAGVPAGAYHALAWHADPVMQAKVFMACAGDRRDGELPFALDLEANSAAELGMTPQECLAHAEACLRVLVEHYGTVVIYTSSRVWADVFGNLPSKMMGACPLWLKVPYAWRERRPPHLDSSPASYSIPGPWRESGSAGVWLLQFQGDAIGLPGTTSTVDLNEWLPLRLPAVGSMAMSAVHDRLATAGIAGYQALAEGIQAFQTAHGLVADGVVGPKTFAALYR